MDQLNPTFSRPDYFSASVPPVPPPGPEKTPGFTNIGPKLKLILAAVFLLSLLAGITLLIIPPASWEETFRL